MKVSTEVQLLICEGKMAEAIVLLREQNPSISLEVARDTCHEENRLQREWLYRLIACETGP